MKTQAYVCTCIGILFTATGIVSAGTGIEHENSYIVSNDLIKRLPTALLDNLHRDLQSQENKENKSIDSIAGISKSKLEAEIAQRQNEDRSQTIGTRTIDPKILPGDLLKYIAEHGVTYNGCNPRDAMNELRNRTGIAQDFSGAMVTQIQAEHTQEQQEKAGEEFAKREDAEDLKKTIDSVDETVRYGKDPAIAKQAEYVKEHEQTSSDMTVDALSAVTEGETVEPAPHGYDSEAQTNRTSEEIKNAGNIVEERNLVEENSKKSFFEGIWDGIKTVFGSWFNGNKDVPNPGDMTITNNNSNIV